MAVVEVLGTAQAVPLDRPVRFELLPGHGDGAWRWNSEFYGRSQVLSLDDEENTVYVVGWWLGGTKAAIWRRTDSRGWEVYDLTRITGKPFTSTSGVDHHNFLVLGIDPNGRVLVNCQDLAGTHPKFAYSGAAGDLSTWTKPAGELPNSGAGADANRLAYPQFWNWPGSGKLARINREGLSGIGNDVISEWDESALTWSVDQTLVDGETASPTHNAYHANVSVDELRGRVWYAWFWRDDGNTQFANYNVYAIYTDDDGVTWKRPDGTVQTVPVTPSNAPTPALSTTRWSVDAIVPGLTMNGLAIDPDGNPHIAHQLFDPNGETQAYHLYWDGDSWVDQRVTDLSWRSIMAQDTQLLSRLGILCTTSGRTFVVGRATVDGRANRPVLWEATPGSERIGRQTVLADLDLGYWEPSIDFEALERGEDTLRMILNPVRPMPESFHEAELIANSAVSDATVTPNFNSHWMGLLEADLSRVDEIDAGHLPRERPLASTPLVPSSTASTAAMADLTPAVASSDPLIPIPAQRVRDDDRLLLVKMAVRAKVDDAAKRGYLQLVLVNDRSGIETVVQKIGAPFEADTGAGRPQGINAAGHRTYATEWTPLPVQADDWDDGGYLKLQGGLNVAGTLTVAGGRVELAELVDADGIPGHRPRRRRTYEEGDALARRKDVLVDVDPDFIGSDVVGDVPVGTVYNAVDALRLGRYTLAEATNLPGRRDNVITGHEILRFDGVNDKLGSTDLATRGLGGRLWKGSYTLVAVFLSAVYTTNVRPILVFGDVMLGINTTGKVVLQKIGGPALAGLTTLGTARRVVIASYGGGDGAGGKPDWAINLDGADDATGTSSNPVPATNTGGNGLSLGSYPGAAGFFQGDLARAGVIGRYLEAAERHALAVSLGAKYGVTIP